MSPNERETRAFDRWWNRERPWQNLNYGDPETRAKIIARVAWSNGAYEANKPVPYITLKEPQPDKPVPYILKEADKPLPYVLIERIEPKESK